MKLGLHSVRIPLGSQSLELDTTVSGNAIGIFGRSGSGKTTLLETIAGLKNPERARIELDGRLLTDTTQALHLPPRHRHMGYVPQDLALFPHLSVRKNLAYGFKLHAEKSETIPWDQVVGVLEIEDLMSRAIGTLSGGEKQRVAFARALMASPRLLLMDEPLASLGTSLRKKILHYLIEIRHEFSIPMLYVSHDMMEIQALCDTLLVLDQGRLVAQGAPDDIFGNLTPFEEDGKL